MIRSFSAGFLQGSSFEHELAPVTLFYGPNWSGKTTRLRGLYLALTGYAPGVGKTNADIFRYCATGNPLTVGFTGDAVEGSTFIRTWSKNGDSVTYRGHDGSLLSPVQSDLAEHYLELSHAARVRFLFSRTKLPEEYSIAKLADKICANIKNIKLEENTEASEQAIAAFVDLVQKLSKVGIASDWLVALAGQVLQAKKDAVASVQRMAKTAQGLTETANREPVDQQAEQKLEVAKKGWRKAVEWEAKANAKSAEAAEKLREAEQAVEQMAGADVSAMRTKAGDLDRQIKNLDHLLAIPAQDSSEAKAALTKAETVRDGTRQAALRSEYQVKSIADKIETTKSEDNCATCGQSVVKLRKKVVAGLVIELRQAEDKACTDKAEADLAEKNFNILRLRVDSLQRAQKQRQERQETRTDLADELRCIEKVLKDLVVAEECKAKLPALREASELAGKETTQAYLDVTASKLVMDELEGKFKLLQAQRADNAARARVKEQKDKAEAEAEIYKQGVSMLNEFQGKLVTAAVGPLVEKANRLCCGILPGELAYRDDEIGLLLKATGRFVSPKTMSDSQKILLEASLKLALATESPFRLVIVDELGRMDVGNQAAFVAGLCKLVADKEIDQAILVNLEPVEVKYFGSDVYRQIALANAQPKPKENHVKA